MSGADLVKRAQGGDSAAFEELYRTCYAPVYRFVYLRLRSKDDAEDITQDVFVKMFGALGQYQDRGGTLLPYLFTIARNAVIDWSRKKKPLYDDDSLSAIASSAPSPEDAAHTDAEVQKVLQALGDVSEAEEAVLKLRYLDGLSTKEVGEILGKSEEAVRQLMSRGLRHMRLLLEGKSEHGKHH